MIEDLVVVEVIELVMASVKPPGSDFEFGESEATVASDGLGGEEGNVASETFGDEDEE